MKHGEKSDNCNDNCEDNSKKKASAISEKTILQRDKFHFNIVLTIKNMTLPDKNTYIFLAIRQTSKFDHLTNRPTAYGTCKINIVNICAIFIMHQKKLEGKTSNALCEK